MSNKHSQYNNGRGFINKAVKAVKQTVKVIIGVRATDEVPEQRREMEFDDEDSMWAYIRKNPRRFLVGFLTIAILIWWSWASYIAPSNEPDITDSVEDVNNG